MEFFKGYSLNAHKQVKGILCIQIILDIIFRIPECTECNSKHFANSVENIRSTLVITHILF